MTFRFIHTSDWQLGKPFGGFEADLAGRLRAERHTAIVRIAEAARQAQARHILVAGDVWDHVTPKNATLRQALDIMAESPDLLWWLMPGNHDPDGPDRLWDRIAEMAPDNIRLLREETPVEMEDSVWLLPAPWQRLHHGRDLTDWMDGADTPDGAIRIGIAHGSIKTFGTKHEGREDGESASVIPPDRAARARLNYLALGDWHALTEINARTFYAGTPEPDRFKSGERGQVLLVEIDTGNSPPTVTPLSTAHFDWVTLDVSLHVGESEAALEEIEARISSGQPARQTLVQVTVSGATTVEEWQQFETYIETLAERCAYLDLRGSESVNLKIVAEDLDTLDAQGSVRQAAEALNAKRVNPDLSQEDREMAAEALRLLFSYAATSSLEDAS
ncbi:MAG: metallophosphoesterase [Pseudomonadota bacterium]